MSQCPHYCQHREEIRSQSIQASRQPAQPKRFTLDYCSHPHSKAPLHLVRGVIGGDKLLKCGGDLAACQVPEGLR